MFRPPAYTKAIHDRARGALAAHLDRALHKLRERHEGVHRISDHQLHRERSQRIRIDVPDSW